MGKYADFFPGFCAGTRRPGGPGLQEIGTGVQTGQIFRVNG